MSALPSIAANAETRPNIVFIIVHDLGTALGCYGEPSVKTPRLDQMAAEGARFANYFCCSTACSPSRGCIVTGRYAHTTGLMGLANRGWSLPATERGAVDHLNDAGYHTANFGGQHERKAPDGYRYKQTGKPSRRKADEVAQDVCEFLRDYDRKAAPFYVNAYSQDVHAPWVRAEFLGKYDPDDVKPPAFLPNTELVRKSMAAFYGSVSFMDEQVGKILDTLNETGLAQNTLVIFTTDHGISFPRAKSTLYDPGLTTALIMRWPGRIKPGTVVNHLLGNIDLLPTQLELLGLPIPPPIQGRSFAQTLLGGSYTPHEQLFMERNFHDDFDPMRCVRTARHKLIRNYSEKNYFKVPSQCTEEDSFLSMRDSGRARPFEELYDLEKDPLEFRNVAGDPAYASKLEDLRQRLDGWMRDTGDYLRGAREAVHSPERDRRVGAPPSGRAVGPSRDRPGDIGK